MRTLTLLVLLALPTIAHAQTYHFEDSLRGASTGNVAGGAFSGSGWTVTGVSDRIWYALPRLRTGTIEFTLANVTLAALPLADHEIFALYEDGHGIGEPIRYSPEFRNNHYKMLIRIYGTAEGARAGSMKFMWGMCPSGAPGYDGCGCASFFEEPFADPGPWTGAPVRIRITWNETSAQLYRDGALVTDVDWSGSGLTFGPLDPHFMLGSPRNDGGLAAMPIGATFSDLVVDGEMGALATCPGGVDAGGPVDVGPLPDAGSCGGATLAIADQTAASWEPGVFPDPSDLNIEGDGAAPQAIAYVRFPAVAGPVSSATLSIDVSTVASAGGGSGVVCRVEGSWDEASLTWASRPTPSTTCVGAARPVAAGETVTFDVGSLITPGTAVSLAIVSTDTDGTHYLSREAGGCAGPRLSYVLAPGTDAPGQDVGTSIDGGNTGMDAGSFDGGRDGGLATRGTATCGCHMSRGGPGWLTLLLVVAAQVLRRRR